MELNTTDRIVSNAKSFQEMLIAAEAEDPLFAKVLLGNVTSASKTQGGAIIAGAITWASTHYGFGWSDDTVCIVSGAIIMLTGVVIHWAQVFTYRNTLPKDLPDLSKTAPTPTTPVV